MVIHNLLVICVFIWISSVEKSNCTTEYDDSIIISIFNQKNATGKAYSQVKIEEFTDKKPSWECDIGHSCMAHGLKCGTPEPKKCNSPMPLYELFPKFGYYKLHTQAKGWNEAKSTCESEGAHLAIINSEEEIQILQELRRRLPRLRGDWLDDIILIGFNDLEKEGVWKTIFNQTIEEAGYAVWDDGQPGTTEHCGCFSALSGKLHDCGCPDMLAFFCEQEL